MQYVDCVVGKQVTLR